MEYITVYALCVYVYVRSIIHKYEKYENGIRCENAYDIIVILCESEAYNNIILNMYVYLLCTRVWFVLACKTLSETTAVYINSLFLIPKYGRRPLLLNCARPLHLLH